jgi:TolB-like protein/Tfp pilus assembly protein PilF
VRDVFVSYAREDRDRVQPVVDALEGAGLSVWWDSHIRPGAGFDDEIQAALDAARAVVVLWSSASIASQWVKEEAREGLRREVLVPVCIDAVEPPLGFRSRQHIVAAEGRYEAVVDAVRNLLDTEDAPARTPRALSTSTAGGSRFASPRMILLGGMAAVVALALLAVLTVGRPVSDDDPGKSSASASARRPATIAVLPFVNTSGDPAQEVFSDGISEEVLNLLARIPELRVTSRTSAFSFKGESTTVPEIGRILGVAHVLEGSVRRAGDTVRVSAQLVDASTDAQIWSDAWDRRFEDIFAIQDEIAAAVADALRIELLGELPQAQETTSEAYALYLRANQLSEEQVAEALYQAEALNERVLELDAGFVPGWVQRAQLYYAGGSYQAWDGFEVAPRVRDAARQALRLDPENPFALAMLAKLAIDIDYDYARAGQLLDRALVRGANEVEVLKAKAEFHYRKNELDESIRWIERAHAVDPLGGHRNYAAHAFFYSGRQAEALELYRERISLKPRSPYLRRTYAVALAERGEFERALDVIEDEPADGHRYTALALIHERLGDRERSTYWLQQAIAAGRTWTWEITEVHAYRGELDEAFKWINRAIERRDRGLRHVLCCSPYIDSMREDPRFEDVLIRLGLKQDA